MSKPLTETQKEAFEAFATERFEGEAEGAFCIGEVTDLFEDDSEWGFHAQNHDPDDEHDLYELLDSCPHFQCEQDGYEDFFVVERE